MLRLYTPIIHLYPQPVRPFVEALSTVVVQLWFEVYNEDGQNNFLYFCVWMRNRIGCLCFSVFRLKNNNCIGG